MNQVSQTLLQQMHITEVEIEARKGAFLFSRADADVLSEVRCMIEPQIDDLVDRFYEQQTDNPEVALKIGDADTLKRLKGAQRRYVIELFQGSYDMEYLNSRLRIGIVHKRIGVEPRLYLSAMYMLKSMLLNVIDMVVPDDDQRHRAVIALEKLCMFDMTLVFETYVRSLLTEVEASRRRTEEYAQELEQRSHQLEEITRTDPLTGLMNRRYLIDTYNRLLRCAKRRAEAVTLVYMDVDDFKKINDSRGHLHGDSILRMLGEILRSVSRAEDISFRYGGDEFCVLLPGCNEEQAQEVYINRMKEEIGRHLPGLVISVGCVQTGPFQFQDAESLIQQADERMYSQKQTVRQRNALAPLHS